MTTKDNTPTDTARSDVDTSISPKCERIEKAIKALKEKLQGDELGTFYVNFLAIAIQDMESALLEIEEIHVDEMDYSTDRGPNNSMRTVNAVHEALGVTP